MSAEDTGFDEDVQKVINRVKADTNAPDWMVQGFVDHQARQHPGVVDRFTKRKEDPGGWNEVEQQLKQGFKQHLREAVTDDGKPTAKKPSEMGSMSLPEYRKTVRDRYGFDPGV
jgi:hypothetical protein